MSEAAAASNQLVSWPVALQCARDRLRSTPVLVFGSLLILGELFVGHMRSGADIFGGYSFSAHVFLLGLTLLLGSALISEELESGHAQLVLLRPLSRAAFFGGRLAGAGIALFIIMAVAWAVGCGAAWSAGRFSSDDLLALPVGFAWAFAWLAVLAAISVVARGASNTFWVLTTVVLWALAKFSLAGANLIAEKNHKWEWITQLHRIGSAVLPYVGPQDPTDLLEKMSQHAAADYGPLLYDLVWIAGAWLLGAFLLSKRELARRRA